MINWPFQFGIHFRDFLLVSFDKFGIFSTIILYLEQAPPSVHSTSILFLKYYIFGSHFDFFCIFPTIPQIPYNSLRRYIPYLEQAPPSSHSTSILFLKLFWLPRFEKLPSDICPKMMQFAAIFIIHNFHGWVGIPIGFL